MCVCVCVCVCVLLILVAVNHYVIPIHYFHSHFHYSEVGIESRASFLLLRLRSPVLLILRCRREDRSVGEREGKVYRVRACVRACVCVLLITLFQFPHFHYSEVGIKSRASFL